MKAHAGVEGVQEQGCWALRNLSSNNDAIKVKTAELGGIEAVLAGMKAHAGAAGVQVAGCRALGHLCVGNTDNQVKVAVLGGIEVVVAGMQKPAGVEGVQHEGCWALSILCANADNVERMKVLGTVRAVVESAMAANPSDANVQRLGQEVLGKLA
ncbi:armadillo-type protein [Baffinella frigidus]|nr:armadillo-type protein [Cryptophyta sp. CCMP2293]